MAVNEPPFFFLCRQKTKAELFERIQKKTETEEIKQKSKSKQKRKDKAEDRKQIEEAKAED